MIGEWERDEKTWGQGEREAPVVEQWGRKCLLRNERKERGSSQHGRTVVGVRGLQDAVEDCGGGSGACWIDRPYQLPRIDRARACSPVQSSLFAFFVMPECFELVPWSRVCRTGEKLCEGWQWIGAFELAQMGRHKFWWFSPFWWICPASVCSVESVQKTVLYLLIDDSGSSSSILSFRFGPHCLPCWYPPILWVRRLWNSFHFAICCNSTHLIPHRP